MVFKKKKINLALSIVTMACSTFSPLHAATNFNYGEALQKAIFFYDVQRLGKVSEATGNLANRVYWRGDSFLQDYTLPNSEGVIDLGGGFADAGDNVKFNFPMAFSTTLLAWAIVDFGNGFTQIDQLTPMLANLHWATDYLLKCWDPVNQRLYGQVSPNSVSAEHSNLWMPYEVVDQASIDKSLPRYGFYVDVNHPGTDLAGETVAALAAASLAFQATDPAYASQLLSTAQSIYTTLVNVPNKGKYSDNMGRMVNGSWQQADITSFYNSWSGYNDEVSWSSLWLYRCTNDSSYLTTAKQYILYNNTAATLSWDDKSYGAYLLLAKFLPDSDPDKATAKASAEGWLNAWASGTNGHSFSTDGLAIASALTPWGNARYAATTAFGALMYDAYFQSTTYDKFAKSQIDYLLGNNSKNFSYMVGFGNAFPKQCHHAEAEGRWDGNNDVSYAGNNRHINYGGLVGGPKDTSDTYEDLRSDYVDNEVALDYNAGFVGALAGLVMEYGGTALPSAQFPPTAATENPPADQFFVNGAVQSTYKDSTHSIVQVDLLATNHSAWPARVATNLKVRYFLNLADKPANGTVQTNVYSTDSRAVVSNLTLFDATNQIYYVEVWFKNIPIYPGGDDRSISSKETQLQFQFSWPHDFTKDWSYQGLGSQGSLTEVTNVPIYDVINGNTQLLFGAEPANVPQGTLGLNFAPNLPTACVGASDTLNINNNSNTFQVGTAASYSMAAGGPYTVSLNSTTKPLAVSGGTCSGSLDASTVNVPGQVNASYTFVATPPVSTGTVQIVSSSQSDPKCSSATDKLFIDQSTTGTAFGVASGVSQQLPVGSHQVALASATSIPAGNNQNGYCTSTLDKSQVTVTENQTAAVNATYTYHANSSGMTCTITSATVTQQSNWGGSNGLVNSFQINFNLQGFSQSNNGITVNGSFTTKNNLVQNFWGNFGMTSSAFTNATGTFTGQLWQNQLPASISGFIYNTTPLNVGDNPLVSMTINGVTCLPAATLQINKHLVTLKKHPSRKIIKKKH